MNNQDLIREELLKFLYKTLKNAKVQKLMVESEPAITKELKKSGFGVGDINSALAYLIDKRYVKKETYLGLGGGKIYKYRISAEGIDYFEEKSKFSRSSNFPGVNITNINGVTVIGDNNIVNNKFSDLYKELNELKEEIGKISSFGDQEKVNFQADIESIKSQLIKNNPSKEFIGMLWGNFKALATINGVIGLYDKINQLIIAL